MATHRDASLSPETRARLVKQRARELGFAGAGITDLEPVPHQEALVRWLEQGMAGTMAYMHRQARRRLDPGSIIPGTTRAVVVTRNYYSDDPPPTPGAGRVARYARGRDYHAALKHPLEELARYIASLGPRGTLAKPYCDAGPVPERELAQRAGLGWIGKNTMFIDPQRGSYCFLAVVLTDLDLALDLPFEADRCGTCRRCLDACPTGALPAPRVLDSRSCISYLTIEHRGNIDPGLSPELRDWVFGCDICQDACPWNIKFAPVADDAQLEHDAGLAELDLAHASAISDDEFEAKFGRTALARAGAAGIRRNAQLALGCRSDVEERRDEAS